MPRVREYEKPWTVNRYSPALYGISYRTGRTLIIFDEIQQSNKALNSLKYFCEETPEYHILAAGSLLGVSLSQGDSFPVGKVEFLRMYPVTFREFLRADTPQMYEYLENLTEIAPLPEIVMGRVGEAYRPIRFAEECLLQLLLCLKSEEYKRLKIFRNRF